MSSMSSSNSGLLKVSLPCATRVSVFSLIMLQPKKKQQGDSTRRSGANHLKIGASSPLTTALYNDLCLPVYLLSNISAPSN